MLVRIVLIIKFFRMKRTSLVALSVSVAVLMALFHTKPAQAFRLELPRPFVALIKSFQSPTVMAETRSGGTPSLQAPFSSPGPLPQPIIPFSPGTPQPSQPSLLIISPTEFSKPSFPTPPSPGEPQLSPFSPQSTGNPPSIVKPQQQTPTLSPSDTMTKFPRDPGSSLFPTQPTTKAGGMPYQPEQLQPWNPGQFNGNSEGALFQVRQDSHQMQRGLDRFQFMVNDAEHKGIKITPEMKARMERTRGVLDKTGNAQNPQDLQNVNVDGLYQDMQSLDSTRADLARKESQLKQMRQGVNGMEQMVNQFEKQLAKLKSQGIALPNGVDDSLGKLKAVIEKVKAAKDPDEMQQTMQDIPDLMGNLNDSRQQLEMLTRWQQTKKQIDREMNQLQKELKRSKVLADKLIAKGVDVSAIYNQFEQAVNKLKSVRDDATSKIQSGDAQSAFDLLENDYFGQMQEVRERARIIDSLSHLTRFAADFKRSTNQARRQISLLKRQKIDTSDLEAMLNDMLSKGNAVSDLMKGQLPQDIDQEGLMTALQDLESAKQLFLDKVTELNGGQDRPWDSSEANLSPLQLPDQLNNFVQPRHDSH